MRPKSRGNGQGTAYKRKGCSSWTASVVVGYRQPNKPGGQMIPVKRTKAGFKKKSDALEYCAVLRAGKSAPAMTLLETFEEWQEKYAPRVGASTMAGYKAAFQHFEKLHFYKINTINAQDLQDCMDACPAGKRTHQCMKVVAGLVWAYAFDKDLVPKDVTGNLYTGKGQSVQRDPLTDEEVEAIRSAMDGEPYAEYVYALCYLGFRPGEFLKLKKADLHSEDGIFYLVGGSKTEAGKARRVPVPAVILPIIQRRLSVEGTDLLFPQRTTNRKGVFTGYKQMSDCYFRESVFKPLMRRLGIAEGKVPYGARHTYSDKLKAADGSDKTKAAIFGHTDYTFTQKKYQSTSIQDIKKVSDSIK
jgi:integrase